MAKKTVIKVKWLQKEEPQAVPMPTAEECLALAEKAEALNRTDWAQYWLSEAERLEVQS